MNSIKTTKHKKLIHITKAKIKDIKELVQVAKDSFLPAHGHSAPKKDIENYILEHFSEDHFMKELSNLNNHYYIIYHNKKLAGYSNITLNTPNKNIASKNVTYLSRLYLLKEFYGIQLGKELFDFNIKFSAQQNQIGIWLAVWVENHRAISFYKKMGFTIVGSFDYKISETHSNPNHIMYLKYNN